MSIGESEQFKQFYLSLVFGDKDSVWKYAMPKKTSPDRQHFSTTRID